MLPRDQADRPRGDVVFCFSYLSWQAAARRGWFGTEDRLARGLLEHERVGRVLVCDQMRSLPIVLVRDLMDRGRMVRDRRRQTARPQTGRLQTGHLETGGDGKDGGFPTSPSARLLRPVGVRREYPTSIAGVERMVGALDRAARRAARQMGLVEPAVIVANPLLAGFAEFEWAGPVTFFATDDWLAYEPQRRWWPAYEESFARVRARGRRAAAVSAAALERIAPSGPSAVIPNGIDPGEWLGAAAEPPSWAARERIDQGQTAKPNHASGQTAKPNRAGEPGRPLLVYAGTLDSRLDVAALLELAQRMPHARVVLVGPLLDAVHLEPLRAADNVEIRPPLARAEVIALIRCADVGMVPHRDNALTRAMSPLKLYEYIAAGLPVVASDLPPMRDVDASVSLVAPGESYAAAVEAALGCGRASEDARAAFIAGHSWRARHDRLLDLALARGGSAHAPA